MGKSTISMAIFHCYVSSPEGNKIVHCHGWLPEGMFDVFCSWPVLSLGCRFWLVFSLLLIAYVLRQKKGLGTYQKQWAQQRSPNYPENCRNTHKSAVTVTSHAANQPKIFTCCMTFFAATLYIGSYWVQETFGQWPSMPARPKGARTENWKIPHFVNEHSDSLSLRLAFVGEAWRSNVISRHVVNTQKEPKICAGFGLWSCRPHPFRLQRTWSWFPSQSSSWTLRVLSTLATAGSEDRSLGASCPLFSVPILSYSNSVYWVVPHEV